MTKKIMTTLVLLTTPLWILPVAIYFLASFMWHELHEMLWGRK